MASSGSKRLSRIDWTDAGLKALEEEGFTAVRADNIARKLGVSRGSFYWHFTDIAAFEAALIKRWRDLVLGALDAPLAHISPPAARMGEILRRSLKSERRVEVGFRAWGTVNPAIRDALDRIDERRLSYMTTLLAGDREPDAALKARARIAYWTYLGHAMTSGTLDADLDAVVDELIRMARA